MPRTVTSAALSILAATRQQGEAERIGNWSRLALFFFYAMVGLDSLTTSTERK